MFHGVERYFEKLGEENKRMKNLFLVIFIVIKETLIIGKIM
jgi:hypothetical protein